MIIHYDATRAANQLQAPCHFSRIRSAFHLSSQPARTRLASPGLKTRVPHLWVLEAGCDSAYSSIESIQQIE